MPTDEDLLGSKYFFCFDYPVLEELAFMSDLSPHVINHKWLCEIVFVIGEWHRLEMQCHHSSRFYIFELVESIRGVKVCVEELHNGSLVLWEVWVATSLVLSWL
ncbi:unnamed protein product [Moneuplotes crassus]|uniref:Uncharacterized protein n=1 Tax=Euplotes crassus TaxID=5936 RepID=A0AAD2D4W0_EUPCR|nr:unnamed protein product [Moneuplotes crassus]